MATPNGEIIPDTAANTVVPVSNFPSFDVVAGDPPDHHFYGLSKSNAASTSTTFQKKVMQEWRILGSNLPETIFVRVYESQMSLLRAAIVGAHGTPYHDALFFFDIYLNPDYPSTPPQLYYHSFGFWINPNLYGSGKVCLSLLNTWPGDSPEQNWDSNQSTILQVLLSIQALVLNEKPFFNEPGIEKSMAVEKQEKAAANYNQHTFLFCCKSTLCLLRNPPANFEVLVTCHFRERGLAILTACEAYRSGAVSVPGAGFGRVNADLVRALDKVGAPVGDYVKQVLDEEREAQRKEKEEMERKRKKGLRKKVMAVVEKIRVGLRLKKLSICNDQVEVKVVN